MGKKEVLPLTNAETAEGRLEELANNKSITSCNLLFNGYNRYSLNVYNGEFRAFPDGFEALDGSGGVLYLSRRTTFVSYDLQKEYEKQNLQDKVEK